MGTPKRRRKAGGENAGIAWAENMRTLKRIAPYLCSEAMPQTNKILVDVCRECRTCAYGRRYVELYDQQKTRGSQLPVKQKEEVNQMAVSKKPASELTLQEQLEQERDKNTEINKINVELANQVQILEKELEDVKHKAAEEHVEHEMSKLNLLRLKAMIFDLEHPMED